MMILWFVSHDIVLSQCFVRFRSNELVHGKGVWLKWSCWSNQRFWFSLYFYSKHLSFSLRYDLIYSSLRFFFAIRLLRLVGSCVLRHICLWLLLFLRHFRRLLLLLRRLRLFAWRVFHGFCRFAFPTGMLYSLFLSFVFNSLRIHWDFPLYLFFSSLLFALSIHPNIYRHTHTHIHTQR